MDRNEKSVTPKRLLSVTDGVFLVAGMVIGVGIFKLPGLVAASAASGTQFFLAWILGGVACLCGALVYAELASRYPETGGEYTFLQSGLGEGAAFVFAWSRMTVIQTGAIAAVAFVFGEYASQIVSLGPASTAIWAALGVAALTGLNLVGTLQSKTLQKVMEILLIITLAAIAIGGIAAGGAPEQPAQAAGGAFTLMMIFVLYTFGGWNEGAYLAGEVRDARRNMAKVLAGGLLVVTVLYLLVNWGYYRTLGLSGLKESKAIAVDAIRVVAGDKAALLIAVVVCVSALTTMNAAIFTGARTNWALGRDYRRLFAFLGNWRDSGSTPANALLAQLAIMLLLIWAGSTTRDGFEAMVAYGLPVFWTFLLLTGITLFIFRRRGGEAPGFRVPLFPIVPLAFLAMCVFMVWSSFDYVANSPYGPKFGILVLAGLVVMAAGIPLYFFAAKK